MALSYEQALRAVKNAGVNKEKAEANAEIEKALIDIKNTFPEWNISFSKPTMKDGRHVAAQAMQEIRAKLNQD